MKRHRRCVKAVSIMAVLTEVQQASTTLTGMIPVLLIRIHNKCRGNNSPAQRVTADTPSKRSVASAYRTYIHS
jgi:hypothetical protein